VSPDGKFFYVTCETEGEIYAIGTKDFQGPSTISTSAVGHARRIFCQTVRGAFIPSDRPANLHVIDSTNHKLLKTIALPKGSRPMCVRATPDGKKIYASTGRGGTVCVLAAGHGRCAQYHQSRHAPLGH